MTELVLLKYFCAGFQYLWDIEELQGEVKGWFVTWTRMGGFAKNYFECIHYMYNSFSIIPFFFSFRRGRNTNAHREQQPRSWRTDTMPVLHIHISQANLEIPDHFVRLFLLGWDHTVCQNHFWDLWLSLFHDLVLNKLEHYDFSHLLFRAPCNCTGKAVSNQKIQVGFIVAVSL